MSFDIMDFRHALHILGKCHSKIRDLRSLFALWLNIDGFENSEWCYK